MSDANDYDPSDNFPLDRNNPDHAVQSGFPEAEPYIEGRMDAILSSEAWLKVLANPNLIRVYLPAELRRAWYAGALSRPGQSDDLKGSP